MSKIMSIQRPQLQDKLYKFILSCKNETEMIRMPCLHSKITATIATVFFWPFFS